MGKQSISNRNRINNEQQTTNNNNFSTMADAPNMYGTFMVSNSRRMSTTSTTSSSGTSPGTYGSYGSSFGTSPNDSSGGFLSKMGSKFTNKDANDTMAGGL